MTQHDHTRKRIRAHFVGAPFCVPRSVTDVQARFSATGYNTGNLLIGDAAARLLDVDIVSSGTVVDLRALKEQADLIVIPSANFLSPAMDLSWLLPIVEGTQHPIVMIGVGAQFPTTDVKKAELPEPTIRLMKIVSERSQSIGARGPFTAEVLAKYGIRNVRVTGCPSLFRAGRRQLTIRKPGAGEPFRPLFNGSSNVIRHAYSESGAREAELKLLELAIERNAPYVLQNEMPEMLAAAGAPEETWRDGCKATLDRLGAAVSLDAYCAYVRAHAKTFYEVDEWSRFVADHDLVVGTRFHGNMIAISQGIAAVFVAHDSRTTELCEALHIPYLGLTAFLKPSLERIIESLDFSSFERHYPAARQNLVDFFAENHVPTRLTGDEDAIGVAFAPTYERFAGPRPDDAAQAADASDDMVEVMKQHLAAKSYDEAILAYERVDAMHPKFRGATLLLAQTLLPKHPQRSAELARRAIELGGADAKTYWICARALYEAGHEDEASETAHAGLVLGGDAEWIAELDKLTRRAPAAG